jgi:PAS domain S-box-containing protein
VVPVEDTINPLFDDKGKMIGAVGVIRDVTERKKAEKEITESRDFLKQLFDISLEGMLVSYAQGFITMANDRAAAILRYSKNELIGKHPALFTTMPEKESARQLIGKLNAHGTLIGEERTWIRGDGSHITVELNVSLMKDAKGNLTGAFSSIRDISERRRADMALRISEERYRRIFENSFVSLQEVDISWLMSDLNERKSSGAWSARKYIETHPEYLWEAIGRSTIVDVNDATLKIYGAKDKEELIGSIDKCFTEESLSVFREALIAFSEGKSFFQAETVNNTFQGVQINILVQINFLIKQRDLNRVLVSIIDITQVKSAEKKLVEYQNQLRALTNELSAKEENERRNLGMYLHDRIGQSLSALKMQLEMMVSELTAVDAVDKCRRILKQIEETIHDTRVLSYELSPVILHELGLEVALGWLAEQTQKQHNMAVSFKSDKKARQLDDSLKIIVYRAVSELLNNVVKHAKADNTMVSMKGKNGQLQITVEDNGIGFDPAEVEGIAATERGFGLFSIRERLNYLGGSIRIKSAPHKGTRITLLAPLK